MTAFAFPLCHRRVGFPVQEMFFRRGMRGVAIRAVEIVGSEFGMRFGKPLIRGGMAGGAEFTARTRQKFEIGGVVG